MSDKINPNWSTIRKHAGPYAPQAFEFVREGLAHTVQMIHGETPDQAAEAVKLGEDRHVSGQQLCNGLRDYAIKRYGLLARTVLNRWNIRRTDDFGKIVFAMIEAGVMRKSDEDTFEAFMGVYDFDEAFTITLN